MPIAARIGAVIICVLQSGCFGSAANTRVTSDYAALIKTVGVVSLLGQQANVSFLSTSAMESSFFSSDIQDWNSERLVYDVLLARLKRKGYEVRELARTDALNKLRAADWRAPLGSNISESIYALGEAAAVDMVIVLHANVDRDFVTKTNQKVRGFGLQKAFDTEAFVYATLFIEAYDVNKRFVAGRAKGNLVEPAPTALWDPRFALKDAQKSLDKERGAMLAQQLTRLITTAIGVAAQEAGI